MNDRLYERALTQTLTRALERAPVVLLNGARQTGKTTLARQAGERIGMTYLTFDEVNLLAAARSDPQGFAAALPERAILDEVQLVPEIFRALKLQIDRDRRPGRFLLTGSADILLLPNLSESLAGRMEILSLWPLSQAEIEGNTALNVVDRLFAPEPLPFRTSPFDREDLMRRILTGGYPEPVSLIDAVERAAWFGSYLTTIVQRDLRDIAGANIEGLSQMPRLLSLLASRAGGLLNQADIARGAGMAYTTLLRYLALLEASFLVQDIPAWHVNPGLRLTKAPKTFLIDTGLLGHLRNADPARIDADPSLRGAMVENFVAMELRKAAGVSAVRASLSHYRTRDGMEVDCVLEDSGGRIVGIEVKSSATLQNADFRGLRSLADAVGERFLRGVILYGGEITLPFGEGLQAAPLSFLWKPA